MKRFKIPVTWKMFGNTYIDANTLEEALSILENAPLPDDSQYLGEFEFDCDEIEEIEGDE